MQVKAHFKNQLINPTLITTIVVIILLKALNIRWVSFEQASHHLSFWLQPAVVALAIPLYVQWQKIRSQWFPIIISQILGSLTGIISGVWLVRLMGGSEQSAIAIAPKSVTMPIAIEVADKLNGVMGITASTVLIAGVVGQMMGMGVLLFIKSTHPMAWGLSMAAASHALGTERVMQLGSRFVAYGTVGLILNGILTALLAPVIVPWLL